MDEKHVETGEKRDEGASRQDDRTARASSSVGPPAAGRRTRDVVFLLLALIVLLGIWLRVHKLAFQSLWNDELWTWQIAQKDSLSDVLSSGRLPRDVHPPLFFMFHYFLQKYVSDSEAAMRMPAVVCGVAAIVAIYLLGRRLYGDVEGLTAAALTAVLWCPIRFSQTARMYSPLLLFTILSTYYAIDLVESLCGRRRLRAWTIAGYVVCAFVNAYIHYFGLFIVVLQAMAAVGVIAWKRRRSLAVLPLFYLPIVLAYVPWLSVVMRSFRIRSFWIPQPTPDAAVTVVRFMFNASDVLVWCVLALWAWMLGRAVYERLTSAATPAQQEPRTPGAGLLLFLWLVVPFAVMYLKSVLSTPVLTSRNLIISVPAAYLLAARGLRRIPVKRTVLLAIVALGVVGMVLQLFAPLEWGGIAYYSSYHRDMIRHGVGFVVANEHLYPGAAVIGCTYGDRFLDYYFEKSGSSLRTELTASTERDVDKLDAFLRRRKPEHIWFIRAHRQVDKAILERLHRDYRGTRFPFYRVDILLLTRRTDAPLPLFPPPDRNP